MAMADAKILKNMKGALVIDFSGNACYDGKFEIDEKNKRRNKKKLIEMFSEIGFGCSAE
jgi:hypothetical protein